MTLRDRLVTAQHGEAVLVGGGQGRYSLSYSAQAVSLIVHPPSSRKPSTRDGGMGRKGLSPSPSKCASWSDHRSDTGKHGRELRAE